MAVPNCSIELGGKTGVVCDALFETPSFLKISL
jgi:hypothetical protein